MALFLSTYVNKVDKKGRVSVPSLFRAALETQKFQGIVVFRSYKHPALEAFGLDRMAQLSQSLDKNFNLFSDTQDDLAASIFADAQQLGFDGEGRITLPDDIAAHAGITESACFVGRGATFQIWAPDTFKQHQMAARTRVQQGNISIALHTSEVGQ
jgi:MraZ protein